MSETLAELPAILDNFFIGVVITINTPIGWGVRVATKWQVKATYHFHVHIISLKAAKPMAKLTSQPCGKLYQAVCLSMGDGAI